MSGFLACPLPKFRRIKNGLRGSCAAKSIHLGWPISAHSSDAQNPSFETVINGAEQREQTQAIEFRAVTIE